MAETTRTREDEQKRRTPGAQKQGDKPGQGGKKQGDKPGQGGKQGQGGKKQGDKKQGDKPGRSGGQRDQ